MGWYCHLEEKIAFPFNARCIAAPVVSPPEKREEVEMPGRAPEEDCMSAMLVAARIAGRKPGVPLVQLEAQGADSASCQGIEDCYASSNGIPACFAASLSWPSNTAKWNGARLRNASNADSAAARCRLSLPRKR
ncbi:MAG: hypothetical protein EXR27_15315 [Betaproteobacteria bacterium]|nr:hypothetical protein [Betaproteobacteria bacterium]